MSANGDSGISLPNTSKEHCSEAIVEIKIKMLDSQTHTLRVNKYVPVPALKEQIANVTGVLSEQQKLICRGKVLKDDELLSAYHVEDGHTLHLVVRQPFSSSSSAMPNFTGSTTTHDHSGLNAANRITSSTSGLVFGPFSLSDQGDPTTSDLSRILSSVIGSFGRGNVRGAEGNDATPQSGGFQPEMAHPTASTGFNPFLGDFQFPSTQPPENQHPTVIPDSSTTLTHYINHIRREFDVNGGSPNTDSQASNIGGTEGQSHNSQSHFSARHGLPTPESLSEVILSARQLLIEQAGECLADLARQLQNQATVSDSQARSSVQSNAIRFGALIQNLGPLLLELGRTIMTLRMGQAPGEAVVNAGPAVFVSDASPTPIMVQAGTTFNGFPLGTTHSGHGPAFSLGPGLLSRNIDIHIRRGHSASVGTTNLAGQSNEQPSERTDAPRNPVDNSGNQAHQGVPRSSSGRESSVRVVPIRTVIAIPGVSRPPTSGHADSYPHPLFARLHQHILGNTNDPINPPASGENPTDGRAQSRISSPTLQSSSFGWIDEQFERINNNLPTNSVSVASETAPTNGQQSDPLASSSSLHRSCDGMSEDRTQGCEREVVSQDGTHAFTRFVSSELQGNATDTEAEAQEAADHGNEDGVFFSSLLHRLMPFISQIATSEPSVSSLNPSISSEQAEVQNSMHVRDIDPSDAPASKRTKRSD